MTSKADLLQQVDGAGGRLDAVLDRIDEVHGTWEGAVGTWSVVNLLQHMDGWLQEMVPPLERLARGERPTAEGVDYSNVDEWNRGFVESRGEKSLADARAAISASQAQFRAAIEAVADDRFGEGKTVNRLVDGTAIEHYAEHTAQLEAFLGAEH